MSKHRSRTHARWGGIVGRGSVVKVDGQKGIVLRLLPLNNFSRAYGRQADVAFYGPNGRVYDRQVGIGDMTVVGKVKHIPKTGTVKFPRHPEDIAHHEKVRDIRRRGQGIYYNPNDPINQSYERPLPDQEETRVLAVHRRKHRSGR